MIDRECMEHIGVKGMRWGKRKTIKKITSVLTYPLRPKQGFRKDYDFKQRSKDVILLNSIFAPRLINRYMNKGLDHKKALKKANRVLMITKAAGKVALGTIAFLVKNPSLARIGKTAAKNTARNTYKKATRFAEDFFLKYASSNIVKDTGEIIMNPRNYKRVGMSLLNQRN